MQRLGVMDWHRSEDFAPLMLVMSGKEEHRLVTSLREVAEALIVAWPTDDGEEYMAAVKICLDAIYGNIPAKAARAALIRAAEEAGIPVIAVVH
ncbi:hypothetical protein QO004_004256 [Rhizobium mesoamericanum]|uniref:DUF982 domain-containing protein n=1 Tax=Rhizobium mesoamericanum TaxID=1079800 RepID=UPI00277FB993|nr:DUF982 domain-containing protein [Rhizobium mesoamericanum]MDQ0562451.1 hypothetical protein [Rhizobium mesoamericanum]